jgi:uncharacterized protein YodC (DUF2158 family)
MDPIPDPLLLRKAVSPGIEPGIDYLGKVPVLRNMDMRFGTWSMRSLYRAGSLMTVSKEVSKYSYKLNLVVRCRWYKGGTTPAGECTFPWKGE